MTLTYRSYGSYYTSNSKTSIWNFFNNEKYDIKHLNIYSINIVHILCYILIINICISIYMFFFLQKCWKPSLEWFRELYHTYSCLISCCTVHSFGTALKFYHSVRKLSASTWVRNLWWNGTAVDCGEKHVRFFYVWYFCVWKLIGCFFHVTRWVPSEYKDVIYKLLVRTPVVRLCI